jgi:hypothetical protein
LGGNDANAVAAASALAGIVPKAEPTAVPNTPAAIVPDLLVGEVPDAAPYGDVVPFPQVDLVLNVLADIGIAVLYPLADVVFEILAETVPASPP